MKMGYLLLLLILFQGFFYNICFNLDANSLNKSTWEHWNSVNKVCTTSLNFLQRLILESPPDIRLALGFA